jgi:MFS family permease
MLAGKYPAKYIIAAGWLALAIGMYVSIVQLDTLISFQSATVLRLIQSVGLGLLFVPVTMAGYIGMPAEKANSVAGIINFMRNIGSSVGTSMVTTLLARRAQVHQVVLSQHTTRFDRSVLIGISLLALGVGAVQVVLDKGQQDDWFSSPFITRLVILSVVCLVGLVIWKWRHKTAQWNPRPARVRPSPRCGRIRRLSGCR